MLQSLESRDNSCKVNPYIFKINEKYKQFKDNNNGYNIFFWIPSHVGIEDNEYADSTAKLATEKPFIIYLKVPYTDMFEIFKKNSVKNTNDIILQESKSKGKQYFEIFYTNKSKPWFHNKNVSRELIVSINRARSNHYHMAESLKKKMLFRLLSAHVERKLKI